MNNFSILDWVMANGGNLASGFIGSVIGAGATVWSTHKILKDSAKQLRLASELETKKQKKKKRIR